MKKMFWILLLSTFATAATAEVYRWVDEQGNVHFGDKPPASEAVDEVKIRKAPTPVPGSDPASRLEAQQKLLNAMREERILKQEAEREAAQQQAERQQKCQRARNELLDYERSSAIYNLDDEGNRIYMSGAERDAFIQKLRDDIHRHCS